MKKILNRLSTNWDKYLLEILVIMIGILSAFGLNNWNENRKDSSHERKILASLLSEAYENQNLLDNIIEEYLTEAQLIRELSKIIHPNQFGKNNGALRKRHISVQCAPEIFN